MMVWSVVLYWMFMSLLMTMGLSRCHNGMVFCSVLDVHVSVDDNGGITLS